MQKVPCNEARRTEEENVGMRDSSDEEEIQLPKCGRKGDAENLNEKKKGNISEEEDIGIRKCRRKIKLINKMRK